MTKIDVSADVHHICGKTSMLKAPLISMSSSQAVVMISCMNKLLHPVAAAAMRGVMIWSSLTKIVLMMADLQQKVSDE